MQTELRQLEQLTNAAIDKYKRDNRQMQTQQFRQMQTPIGKLKRKLWQENNSNTKANIQI